jgi:hypothetical protein
MPISIITTTSSRSVKADLFFEKFDKDFCCEKNLFMFLKLIWVSFLGFF